MKYFYKAAKRLAAAVAMVSTILVAQAGISGAAYADKAPTVVLIVSMGALLNESEVGQDVSRQVRDLVSALQAEDLTTRQALAAEAESVRAQAENLTPEELQAKAEDLAQRQQTHVQKIAVRQQEIQRGQAQANRQIKSVLGPIFNELLLKHGSGLLIDQSYVLAGGLDLNITSEAMAMLNQRLSKLTVTPVSAQ
jgi:Skp family chaperone for outer membrane proteins